MQRDVDARDAADEAEQALRRVQRDVGRPLVGALVAEVEVPVTVSVLSLPPAEETRSLSPTLTPRSLASSVPISMSVAVSRVVPRTILSGIAMIRK